MTGSGTAGITLGHGYTLSYGQRTFTGNALEGVPQWEGYTREDYNRDPETAAPPGADYHDPRYYYPMMPGQQGLNVTQQYGELKLPDGTTLRAGWFTDGGFQKFIHDLHGIHKFEMNRLGPDNKPIEPFFEIIKSVPFGPRSDATSPSDREPSSISPESSVDPTQTYSSTGAGTSGSDDSASMDGGEEANTGEPNVADAGYNDSWDAYA